MLERTPEAHLEALIFSSMQDVKAYGFIRSEKCSNRRPVRKAGRKPGGHADPTFGCLLG
jgi:hypothetical protein